MTGANLTISARSKKKQKTKRTYWFQAKNSHAEACIYWQQKGWNCQGLQISQHEIDSKLDWHMQTVYKKCIKESVPAST